MKKLSFKNRWWFLKVVTGIALCTGLLFIADYAQGQMLQLDLGENTGSSTGRIIQIIALVTVLSLTPAILIMMTSFTRIVIVLSFARTAIGAGQTPPNQVIIGLAFFLTLFIMLPTLEESYEQGILPIINEDVDEMEGISRALVPFRTFMQRHVRDRDLALFMDMEDTQENAQQEEVSLKALIPAFMISELRRAFEIGFLIFVPFLVIDMVVASILMAMGMMMLPPVVISLPFKIVFFVLVDGWYMLAGSLIQSFGG